MVVLTRVVGSRHKVQFIPDAAVQFGFPSEIDRARSPAFDDKHGFVVDTIGFTSLR